MRIITLLLAFALAMLSALSGEARRMWADRWGYILAFISLILAGAALAWAIYPALA